MPNITWIDPEPFFTMPHRTSGPAGVPLHDRLPFYRAYATGLPGHVKGIVLTSDLQGREAGGQNRLLGAPVAEALVALSRDGVIPAPDAVFLCDDLYDYPDCHKRGGTGPVDEVFLAFSAMAPEVVGVLGNHDQVAYPGALPDNTNRPACTDRPSTWLPGQRSTGLARSYSFRALGLSMLGTQVSLRHLIEVNAESAR
ncbi:MAG: hypothetical protein ACQEV6_18190 [Pseudomonadota bacterium]